MLSRYKVVKPPRPRPEPRWGAGPFPRELEEEERETKRASLPFQLRLLESGGCFCRFDSNFRCFCRYHDIQWSIRYSKLCNPHKSRMRLQPKRKWEKESSLNMHEINSWINALKKLKTMVTATDYFFHRGPFVVFFVHFTRCSSSSSFRVSLGVDIRERKGGRCQENMLYHDSAQFPLCLNFKSPVATSPPSFSCAILGAPPPFSLPTKCLCGSLIESSGQHLVLCPFRNPQCSHDAQVNVVYDLAREGRTHVSHAHSLLHLHPDSSKVPDARIDNVIIDFEQINPCAPSSFDSYGNPKPVAQYAENSKTTKHGDAAASIHCRFVPFIVERFGSFAPKAFSYFFLINRTSPDTFNSPNWIASSTSSYWSNVFLSLWNNNAAELLLLRHRCLKIKDLSCLPLQATLLLSFPFLQHLLDPALLMRLIQPASLSISSLRVVTFVLQFFLCLVVKTAMTIPFLHWIMSQSSFFLDTPERKPPLTVVTCFQTMICAKHRGRAGSSSAKQRNCRSWASWATCLERRKKKETEEKDDELQ